MATAPPSDAEYEALVRQQLTELGYNSDAIPDEVLREFLADFEEKMELGSGEGAANLSYPSALNAAEKVAAKASPKKEAPKKATPKAAPKAAPKKAVTRTPPSASKTQPPAKKPACTSASVAAAGEATAASADAYAAAVDIGDAPAATDATGGADAATKEPVPKFDSAQWAALKPGGSRPSTAPARSKATTPRGGLISGSGMVDGRPPLGSASGVIVSNSTIGTPRKPKSDPVSMHARRQAQWSGDSYLSLTKKPILGPPMDMTPAPATVKTSRRRVNTYVVPTAKRRDDLVWQTRQRLQAKDSDANGVAARVGSGSKTMVPNFFVPATEKRRDDLRWAVRTEMALMR